MYIYTIMLDFCKKILMDCFGMESEEILVKGTKPFKSI